MAITNIDKNQSNPVPAFRFRRATAEIQTHSTAAKFQNFTMIANLMLASLWRRSGQNPLLPTTQVKPGVGDRNRPGTNEVSPTSDPAVRPGIVLGEPLTPGVIPPRPEKYGTFAWRYPYSVRKVMYCWGIQSKVSDVSHALNGSPGFCVK